MQFDEIVKQYRVLESESYYDAQSFLRSLVAPDLNDFKRVLKIQRWRRAELGFLWSVSATAISIGLVLLIQSHGRSHSYSTVLILAGLLSATYAYRRVLSYFEWFREVNKREYELTMKSEEA